MSQSTGFTKRGEYLVPGYNVDRVDLVASLALATAFGYGDPQSQMVATYALRRWSRGEETGADRTALSGGIDLTSWRAILAAGCAAAAAAAGMTAPRATSVLASPPRPLGAPVSNDNVTAEQRMSLQDAVNDYLETGATTADLIEDVETFIDDYRTDNASEPDA